MAAQVPCKYCTYAHTEFAKLDGATQQEIGEAVLMAALTRHWSTVLQGQQTDLARFKAEIARLADNMKKWRVKAPPAPIDVVDAATAKQDMEQTLRLCAGFHARSTRPRRSPARGRRCATWR